MASDVRIADGTLDFSSGIDSGRVTTVQSESNPNGLSRQMLAWLTNATVRGGGVTQRPGWQPLVKPGITALYQGGYLYEPELADPYLILSIAGHIYQVLVDAPYTVTDLSVKFNLFNPSTPTLAYFAQGEQFLVIQAGDYLGNVNPTLPLFWDGNILRRSVGLVNPNPPPPQRPPINTNVSVLSNFVMPAVGGSVTILLGAPYPDSVNLDPVSFNQLNTVFKPSAPSGNNITLTVISTPVPGYQVNIAGSLQSITTIPPAAAGQPAFVAELPAAGPMIYYQGRIWYAQGKVYTAGDIVSGPSGTIAYNFKDSILKVTENPLAIGGDGFNVPDNSGDIRALNYVANENSILGQGPLIVFTRKQIYSLNVPIARADWIAANASNQPIQTISQRKWGAVGDRCIVPVNGDLFYQTMEPAIRSLKVSVRNDDSWQNVAISTNEDRIIQQNNRALMMFATGINFDNRLWQAVLPVQTPVGVAFQAVVPLDFYLISTLQEKLPPAWEGAYEGLDHLQLFEGDFGGLDRAFSVAHSREDGTIQIWEMTTSTRADNGDSRVTWFLESPAFTWSREFDQKDLDGGEIWVDQVFGDVVMKFEYRVDADPCWILWHQVEFCAARTPQEDASNLQPPNQYPAVTFCPGFKFPITLPKPQPGQCETMSKRPSTRGYQFQVRLTVLGYCRIRGVILWALPVERAPFDRVSC